VYITQSKAWKMLKRYLGKRKGEGEKEEWESEKRNACFQTWMQLDPICTRKVAEFLCGKELRFGSRKPS
jgi:hypothetical protein